MHTYFYVYMYVPDHHHAPFRPTHKNTYPTTTKRTFNASPEYSVATAKLLTAAASKPPSIPSSPSSDRMAAAKIVPVVGGVGGSLAWWWGMKWALCWHICDLEINLLSGV